MMASAHVSPPCVHFLIAIILLYHSLAHLVSMLPPICITSPFFYLCFLGGAGLRRGGEYDCHDYWGSRIQFLNSAFLISFWGMNVLISNQVGSLINNIHFFCLVNWFNTEYMYFNLNIIYTTCTDAQTTCMQLKLHVRKLTPYAFS